MTISPPTFTAVMSVKEKNSFCTNKVAIWNGYGKYGYKHQPDKNPCASTEMLHKASIQFFLTYSIGALGMLIQVDGNVVLRCVFGIQQYTQQPQEMRTDLFNWYYAYAGDVVDGESPLVEVKASCFDIVQSTNV